MFTGIVEAMGSVVRLDPRDRGARLTLRTPGITARTGESVAVEGACLTAIEPRRAWFTADLSAETLRRTTLGGLEEGAPVNLERSLRVGDRIGGHFVLGHVDAVGRVVAFDRDASGARLVVRFPLRYHRLVVAKGSLAVSGVSLTVATSAGDRFEVALIPHTLEVTSLGGLVTGDRVNLEFDYLAKVVLGFTGDPVRTRARRK